MVDVGTAALQIIPSFQGFQGKLESGSSGALTSAGTSGGRKFGDSAGRSMVSSFKSHARTAALAGSAALATAGYALFKFGQDSIAEARESQRVGALTASTIKATGAAANVTAKQVGDLSGALSLKTGIDDEVIQRGANMLLTFKDIRNEVGKNNDIFDQATKITTDMAAAMAGGQGGDLDLKSSSILVGKALNDPAKGLTALTRVGVSFTDQQKEQIGSLVESGKTMAAQKVILSELTSEFGGAAAAQATMGDKVKTAWGNIEEQLGTALLPLLEDAERWFLKKGVPAIEGWVDAFEKKGVPALKHLYEKAKPVAEEMLPKLGEVLGTVKDVLADAAPYARDLVDAFLDMPDWAKKGLVLGGLGAYGANKLGVTSLLGGRGGAGQSGSGLIGMFTKASPMPVYVVNEMPGVGVPGGAPKGTPSAPTVIPGGGPSTVGKLPQFAPFIPVGLGSYHPDNMLPKESSVAANFQGPKFDLTSAKYADETADKLKALMAVNTLAQQQIDKTVSHLAGFPDKLITDIQTNGVPESIQAAKALARQYDLSAKDRTTLFKTLGIPQAKTETASLAEAYKRISGPIVGHVSVDTSAAEANLNRVLNLINTVNHQSAINAERGIGAVPHAPSPRRAPAQINIHVGGERVASVIDDRIGTNEDLADERGRANR